MKFDLTGSLIDDIIFAMEDQNGEFCVDADSLSLIPCNSEFEDEFEVDEENYYSIPDWSSDDGFELMQSFTESLRSPEAKSRLRRAVTAGRGVFRKFKQVLSDYPEVEKLWFAYKNKMMGERISEWYNSLREFWGLEKLESCAFSFEETDDLVESDFQFLEYSSSEDRDDVDSGCALVAGRFGILDEDLASVFRGISENQKRLFDSEEKRGFVCRSVSGEFAGCILYSSGMSSTKKNFLISEFFVEQKYLGLGIGRTLMDKCLHGLEALGAENLILFNIYADEALVSLLENTGFEKIGTGFVYAFGEKNGL